VLATVGGNDSHYFPKQEAVTLTFAPSDLETIKDALQATGTAPESLLRMLGA